MENRGLNPIQSKGTTEDVVKIKSKIFYKKNIKTSAKK